jgi:hypothetical protein
MGGSRRKHEELRLDLVSPLSFLSLLLCSILRVLSLESIFRGSVAMSSNLEPPMTDRARSLSPKQEIDPLPQMLPSHSRREPPFDEHYLLLFPFATLRTTSLPPILRHLDRPRAELQNPPCVLDRFGKFDRFKFSRVKLGSRGESRSIG